MSLAEYTDYRELKVLWAKRLNVSKEAIELYLDCEVIDPHTVTYLWKRLVGYDLLKKHKPKPFGIGLLSQVDFPRCLEANMSGVVWDITTNPLVRANNKLKVLRTNIDNILNDISKCSDKFEFVRSYNDYVKARENNKIACWISIQGGQALDQVLDLDQIPEVHRITLMHFTRSKIGKSSFDPNKQAKLTSFGEEFVQKMVENKILIDLSHINKGGFYQVNDIVPKDIPLVVTHTGINRAFNSWRNLDDEQVKMIAERNGSIGIIYEKKFLSSKIFTASSEAIIDHMEAVIEIVGDDYVTLGSDYDGMIVLPNDFRDITFQPVMVQKMLDRGWDSERIKKIMGKNFLRVLKSYQ